jgi:transposase
LVVNDFFATGGYDADADVNGTVNTLDRLLVMHGRNKALAPAPVAG